MTHRLHVPVKSAPSQLQWTTPMRFVRAYASVCWAASCATVKNPVRRPRGLRCAADGDRGTLVFLNDEGGAPTNGRGPRASTVVRKRQRTPPVPGFKYRLNDRVPHGYTMQLARLVPDARGNGLSQVVSKGIKGRSETQEDPQASGLPHPAALSSTQLTLHLSIRSR